MCSDAAATQVDNFTFQDHVALPASLRYVAIYNEAFELLRPIGTLLKVCRWGLYALHHRHHAPATCLVDLSDQRQIAIRRQRFRS